jgi:hypothetical protein
MILSESQMEMMERSMFLSHSVEPLQESIFSRLKEKSSLFEERKKEALEELGLSESEFSRRYVEPMKRLVRPRKSDLTDENRSKSLFTRIIDAAKNIVKDMSLKGMVKATIFFIIFYLVISFVYGHVVPLLGLSKMAEFVVINVILGPIIEEVFKFISTKGGFGGEFVLVFNIFEFMQYMRSGARRGVDFAVMLTARTYAALSHFFDVIIQKAFIEYGEEIDSEKVKYIGIILTTFLHMVNNAISTVGQIKSR